jgi:hypothetical protein
MSETFVYVQRDQENKIVAVSRHPQAACLESIAIGDRQLQYFAEQLSGEAYDSFAKSDLELARVLEDVVNLLAKRGLINIMELPLAAQQKLIKRQELREQYHGVYTLDESDNLPL